MFTKISSFGLFGLNAFPVDVEIETSRGIPQFDIVGLPDTAVRESRERIRAALRSCGTNFPVNSVMINLAPASTKKSGSVHDMAIMSAVLCSMNMVNKIPDDCAFIGEVSLGGDFRYINGVLPMVILARELGKKSIFVPYDNAHEASVIQGINVYAVKNTEELISHLRNERLITPCKNYIPPETEYNEIPDFADVKGQQSAKKALEIAAAGGHNVILIGPPGSGKSMLAKRMPSILPPLSFEEAIETTKIYSTSGLLDAGTPIITKRPFRSPHHTTSATGLIGGGQIPHPGEISLAHNGVLFLDELTEFNRRTLDDLRQPIEDRQVTISRAAGTISYPCSVMLIAATNPCPCGYFGHPKQNCTCSPNKIKNYISKISGPLLDRFDLHIEANAVDYKELSSKTKEESSAQIRKRVMAAREIQSKRFKGTSITCNALITDDKIHDICAIDDAADAILQKVMDNLNLSGRAYNRILKVARTIADIEGSEMILRQHIAAATQYRSLDRKYWN